MVIQSNNHSKVTDQQVADIRNKVASITGFTDQTVGRTTCPVVAGNPCVAGPNGTSHPKDETVRVIQNGLVNANDAAKKIDELRAITPPKGYPSWSAARRPSNRIQHPQPVRQGSADAGRCCSPPPCC